MKAASECLQRPILVISGSNVVVFGEQEPGKPIFIYQNKENPNHYDALLVGANHNSQDIFEKLVAHAAKATQDAQAQPIESTNKRG